MNLEVQSEIHGDLCFETWSQKSLSKTASDAKNKRSTSENGYAVVLS